MTLRVIFSILNNLSLRRNINLNIRKFTRANKHLFWQKWTPDVFSYFRPPCLCPSEGHKRGVSVLCSINLCGTFCQIEYGISHRPDTWTDALFIYPLYNVNFLTSFMEWFRFFFSMAWQWKPRIACATSVTVFRLFDRAEIAPFHAHPENMEIEFLEQKTPQYSIRTVLPCWSAVQMPRGSGD